jgi:hypothetical protein
MHLLFQGNERVYQDVCDKIETHFKTGERLHGYMLDAIIVSEEKCKRTSGIFHDSRAIVCEKLLREIGEVVVLMGWEQNIFLRKYIFKKISSSNVLQTFFKRSSNVLQTFFKRSASRR